MGSNVNLGSFGVKKRAGFVSFQRHNVSSFCCLFSRSLRAETHLGPDGTRLKQYAQAILESLYKHAGQLVHENVKKETDLKI